MRADGSQIAESTNASIRNAIGAIVMINGDDEQYGTNATKAALLNVNISGVTIDGDGVYADGGVVFRDAQGTISRSRVTNVVTTETSYDVPRPGEYKGSNDGYAIASVTAGGAVPLPTTPRVVKVDHTRIDKYNAAGILLDGATGDTLPLTASGVTTKGVIGQNQIVGRTVCINYEPTGNCSNPQPATNGPLYGQDGIRITAGSSATITDTLISQNLVQGTGAPMRNSTTNGATLCMGAGVRLIGAAATLMSKSNIVDNAYGVYNAQLDGTTANTAVAGQGREQLVGPAHRQRHRRQPRPGDLADQPGRTRRRRRTRSTAPPIADGTGVEHVGRRRLLPVPQRLPVGPEHRRVPGPRRSRPGQ